MLSLSKISFATPNPQIVEMSAILRNITELAKVFSDVFRPVSVSGSCMYLWMYTVIGMYECM